MRFEITLAYRHLRHGSGQTLLTVGAVAIAVAVVIFMQSLLAGVSAKSLNDLAGSLAHITVKPPDQKPRVLAEVQAESRPAQPRNATQTVASASSGRLLASDLDKQISQRKFLTDWRQLERQIAQFPGVRVVAATARGDVFLIRGAKRQGALALGGEPAAVERVYALQKHLVAGRWLDIGPDEMVIGWRLADEVGVRVGDRINVQSSQGITNSFRVAGIFDFGNDGLDLGRVYMTLRAAQSLFAMQQDVSTIDVKLDDLFEANRVADRIAPALNLKADSWLREQGAIVSALQAQNITKYMICAFALLASSFAIASVLIVSVIQKNKQIGILKSMGARDAQILWVFTLEGLGVALLGSLVGSGVGYVLVAFVKGLREPARFGRSNFLLDIVFDPNVFLGACAAAVLATLLAAFLPAWRAARMNPVDAIRGE